MVDAEGDCKHCQLGIYINILLPPYPLSEVFKTAIYMQGSGVGSEGSSHKSKVAVTSLLFTPL